jgi:EAL domain-containing protein (putative c-di-GMP-specific phosphodiesterase class I)
MDQTILTALSPSTDQMLRDAAKRALAAPRGRLAVVLHLSRLRAQRSYHSRIARPVLDQAAPRHGGMVFARCNGDLVMLGHAPDAEEDAVDPGLLVRELLQLFGTEAAESALVSLWLLGSEAAAFRAYLEEPAFTPPVLPAVAEDVQPGHTAAVAEWQKASARMPVPELLSQQTAVVLHAGRDVPIGSRLSPLFRELSVRGPDGLDPWLERHVSAGMDARLLAHLLYDLEEGGRLTRASVSAGLALHINLSLPSIVSPAFARLTQAARAAGARFGVEISMTEAFADLPMLDYAAALLRHAGFAFVLEGLDEASLGLARLHPLEADLVKLDWSHGLLHAPGAYRTAIEQRLRALGAERLLLDGADTADAVAWGQTLGITRFQGSFLDSVQGATRMFFCHTATLCTLRQCVSRGALAGTPGRAGCANPAMLDLPPEAPPGADTVRGALLLQPPVLGANPAHRW